MFKHVNLNRFFTDIDDNLRTKNVVFDKIVNGNTELRNVTLAMYVVDVTEIANRRSLIDVNKAPMRRLFCRKQHLSVRLLRKTLKLWMKKLICSFLLSQANKYVFLCDNIANRSKSIIKKQKHFCVVFFSLNWSNLKTIRARVYKHVNRAC